MTTFSTSLKLELPGDGQQSGTWGQTTNKNLGTLLEQAITGVQYITMVDANYTLTDLNGVSDEARNAVIVAQGTNSAVRDIIAPLTNKLYTVVNNTVGGYSIRIRAASGSAVTVANGVSTPVYCDGTNFYSAINGVPGNFAVAGNETVTGTLGVTGAITATTATFSGAISSVSPAFTGTPTAPTAASGTNTTQIATTAFANNAVTTGTAANAVNATNLTGSGTISSTTTATTQSAGTNNTTVATTAFVTTAVAAGAYAGPGAQVFTSSGTFTIPSGVTKLKVYVTGGGGAGTYTGGGGGGGTAIKWLTGLTPGNTLAVTVGGASTASTVASGTQTITTLTGGAGGDASSQTGGAGGTATNGDLNLTGNGGVGPSGVVSDSSTREGGAGGGSFWGGGGRGAGGGVNGVNGGNYGGGGSGYGYGGSSAGTGASGVVVFEW